MRARVCDLPLGGGTRQAAPGTLHSNVPLPRELITTFANSKKLAQGSPRASLLFLFCAAGRSPLGYQRLSDPYGIDYKQGRGDEKYAANPCPA